MHDYSRDIMLATAQEHIETRMLLSAAENKSQEMEAQLKKLEEITKKTDEILYQMIPKAVAERLRFVGKSVFVGWRCSKFWND